MSEMSNERALIEKAKAGDEVSFELLIDGCKARAYNTALRFLRDEDDAMDVLQDSLIKVFRHLNKFNGTCKFDTWVYRIVVNSCNDFLRKNKHHRSNLSLNYEGEDGEMVFDLPDDSPTPQEALDAKLSSSFLLDCLEKMPAKFKEVIILRDVQGFTYEEIGEIKNCSLGTVKSRINRARQKLKLMVLEQLDEKPV
jgi:RNA polymerase sigma factor (sigma-70 family)